MSEQKYLYCAIDTETTGLNNFTDQVVQVTIIPLFFDKESESEFFKIDNNRSIFNQFIIPSVPIDPGASKVTGLTLEVLKKKNAISPTESVRVFKKWFATLGVKTILPIGHNWTDFDKMFLVRWLEMGGEKFSDFFGYQNRDTLVLSHLINDVHVSMGMKPFNSKLHQIVKDSRLLDETIRQRLKTHLQKAHNAFDDCIVVIELYNNFMLMFKNYYHFITLLPEVGSMYQDADIERNALQQENQELNEQVAQLKQELEKSKCTNVELITQRDQLNEVLDSAKEYLQHLAELDKS
jgi:DNA polymerase III epsilon subunit-like protein